MLSLVLAVAIGIRPVRTIPALNTGADAVRIAFAHDDQFEYLGTPAGLYRSRRFADPAETATLIAFLDRSVHAVAVDGNFLYAVLGDGWFATSTRPTLMRSPDQGETFIPIDAALADCRTTPCEYHAGHHIEFSAGAMFVELGGNLLVTRDGGQQWTNLYGMSTNGIPELLMCPLAFTVVSNVVYLGSECPLDVAWISRGTLSADLLSWSTRPQRFDLEMANRNVQFIRNTNGAGVLAGVEGGLIAPDRYLIRYESSAPQYPYIRELIEPAKYPGLMLAGGFDKANDTGYLALSGAAGSAWSDESASLPAGTKNVATLAESADGTLFAVLQSATEYTIATIDVSMRPKRRAIRR